MQKIKIGIDEAGRGPWAGPVVACALAFDADNLPEESFLSQINDSKKLTTKKREALYAQLIEMSLNIPHPQPLENKPHLSKTNLTPSPSPQGEGDITTPQVYFGVGVVDNYVIDEINIKQANREAMRRAIIELKRKIQPRLLGAKEYKIDVFIDGNDNYSFEELDQKPIFIIGGDAKVLEIGAASIVAKVFRDKLMGQYATLYPQLGLDTNQGYGTKKHRDHLQKPQDITGIHRTSYKPVKLVEEKKEKLLLHICCGPDATVPIMDLKKDYEVVCFWYDPNIQPKKEHDKRVRAFKKVCRIEGVEFIIGEYDVGNFFKKIKGLEATPEKGEKCTKCYDMRLQRSALEARKLGITYWTSTLNTSPHKDLEKMFSLGEKHSTPSPQVSKTNLTRNPSPQGEGDNPNNLQAKLEFLKIAFRKNKGFERSVEYTKEHKIYRQNYCGCIYSDTFPGGKQQFLDKLKK